MMDTRHPASVREIPDWCKAYRLPTRTGRLRFAQREVLLAIGRHEIGRAVAFKGGNALRLMHENPRGTLDLDFTASQAIPDDADWISQRVQAALGRASPSRGIKMRVQSIRRLPPRPDAVTPTYSVRVGFCLDGDRGFIAGYIESGKATNEVVEVEISLNDIVCESTVQPVDDDPSHGINTCTLDDILAEKLRSLLQQPIRNRSRPQDVYDIAKQWRDHRERIGPGRVRAWMVRKCAARAIEPRRSSFDEDISSRAEADYERLRSDTGDSFIEFAEAWDLVLHFVSELGLPD